jgi:hypothetical protein
MINSADVETISQRSLERVKNLGEVFTPPSSVEDMLKLLSSGRTGFWSDENNVFFEPNCGHGNIVIGIYRKRLQALYKKAVSKSNKEAALYAVANAINTLWAIDIDAKNVNQCRERVLVETLTFLKQMSEVSTTSAIIRQHPDFMAHLLCAINWHIQENETLSSLSSKQTAKANAEKTKAGKQWFIINGHHPVSFDLSWIEYYQQCQLDNLVPFNYEKAARFVNNILTGNYRKSVEFDFANNLATQENVHTQPLRKIKQRIAG